MDRFHLGVQIQYLAKEFGSCFCVLLNKQKHDSNPAPGFYSAADYDLGPHCGGVIFSPPEGSMLSKNGAYITNAYQAFRSDQMQ